MFIDERDGTVEVHSPEINSKGSMTMHIKGVKIIYGYSEKVLDHY